MARELGRSPAGIYKILKEESCPIRTNKKVDARIKYQIQRLYYEEGLSTPEIAKKLDLAKQTILYWLGRMDNPIPKHIRDISGSNSVLISSADLDLLPFVDASHLRWADDEVIMLRFDNSRLAIVSRFANAKSFFMVAGFYLAEGSKTTWRAQIANTNFALMERYLALVQSFIRSRVSIRGISKKGNRLPQRSINIGGICLKNLLINAINGIISYLSRLLNLTGETIMLGLAFLNGCSDGDGGVLRACQPKSAKKRAVLHISEGRQAYASKLARIFRNILGVGWLYKPRRRAYYQVMASLSPKRAALLLSSGFFSKHPESRKRLALKALDSVYISRYVRLFSLFGSRPFSREDLEVAPEFGPDFRGRSVTARCLMPVGVVRTKGKRPHWCRAYTLSRDTQILAQEILEAIGDIAAFSHSPKGQEFQRAFPQHRKM